MEGSLDTVRGLAHGSRKKTRLTFDVTDGDEDEDDDDAKPY